MCTVISDVCKPHWNSECNINKRGMTSYHQEEKPLGLSKDAVDWVCVCVGCAYQTSTHPLHVIALAQGSKAKTSLLNQP